MKKDQNLDLFSLFYKNSLLVEGIIFILWECIQFINAGRHMFDYFNYHVPDYHYM